MQKFFTIFVLPLVCFWLGFLKVGLMTGLVGGILGYSLGQLLWHLGSVYNPIKGRRESLFD